MPSTLPRIAQRIEARWGLPLPSLLRDFAAQSLSQAQTCLALGISDKTLTKYLRQHDLRDLFRPYTRPAPDSKAWIDRVEQEYNMPLDALLRAECAAARATKTTATQLAADFGVPKHRVHCMLSTLGIKWPRVGRPTTGDTA